MILPVLFINRDADAERRTLMEAALQEHHIEASRVSGVDGYNVPQWLKPYYDGQLTKGETGCSASHLVAAAEIISSEIPAAIVLEDDARPVAGFLDIVGRALAVAPPDWDVIRLCRSSSRPIQKVASLGDGRNLVRYTVIPYGTAAQIVSARGAKKLLAPRKIAMPIDHEIRSPWKLDLNIYGIDPSPVFEVDRNVMPSTIIGRTRPVKKDRLARLLFNLKKMGLSAYANCLLRHAVPPN